MLRDYLYLWKVAWGFAREQKRRIILANIGTVIYNGLRISQPTIFGFFINSLQEYGVSNPWLSLRFLVLFLCISILAKIIKVPSRIVETTSAFHIKKNINKYIFNHITHLPMAWHRKNPTGNTIDRLEKASGAIYSLVRSNYRYLGNFVSTIGIFIGISIVDIKFAILSTLGLMFILLIMWFADREVGKITRKLNEKEHLFSALRYDYFSKIRTVIALKISKLLEKKFLNTFQNQFREYRYRLYISQAKWSWHTLAFSLLSFGIITGYIFELSHSKVTILVGSVVILYQYLQKLSGIFEKLSENRSQIIQNKENWKSIIPILLQERINSKSVKQKDWKTLTLRDIHFDYQKNKQDTLKDFCLNVPEITLTRGKNIAFIGESGSGKSTMLQIISQIDKPQGIKIFRDGEEELHPFFLLHNTTLIPQTPETFEDSLVFNISFKENVSQEEIRIIRKSIQVSQFNSVVESLPEGLNTYIHEHGVNLSGGQNQRLGLARGIYQGYDKSILLLDEPTSSVDSQNELLIYKNIFNEFKDKCIISTIHNLDLLPLFDCVYLFKDGVCVKCTE